MQKYTKFIIALAGVILPFLETAGVPLPEFLTVDWLQGIILAITPMLVFYFPNKDPHGMNLSNTRSPAIVGILALLLASTLMSACGGTRAAYKAAEGLEETAYVMNNHYLALVREANDLAEAGDLAGSNLVTAQDLVRKSRPLMQSLSNAAQVYTSIRTAETEAELTAAIAAAAVELSNLVNMLQNAGGTTYFWECMKPDPWSHERMALTCQYAFPRGA